MSVYSVRNPTDVVDSPPAPATQAALATLVVRMAAQHPERFGGAALRQRRNHWAGQAVLGCLLSGLTAILMRPTSRAQDGSRRTSPLDATMPGGRAVPARHPRSPNPKVSSATTSSAATGATTGEWGRVGRARNAAATFLIDFTPAFVLW